MRFRSVRNIMGGPTEGKSLPQTRLYDEEFEIWGKALGDGSADATPLSIKPVRTGSDALFCAIYNECFFDVPNSRLMDDAFIKQIEADEKRDAGFLMVGGEPVGIFALDTREEVAEIAALAIRRDFRMQGYGKRALCALEARLMREGYTRVQLLLTKRNAAACALYRACGYRFMRKLTPGNALTSAVMPESRT